MPGGAQAAPETSGAKKAPAVVAVAEPRALPRRLGWRHEQHQCSCHNGMNLANSYHCEGPKTHAIGVKTSELRFLVVLPVDGFSRSHNNDQGEAVKDTAAKGAAAVTDDKNRQSVTIISHLPEELSALKTGTKRRKLRNLSNLSE